MIPCSYGFTTCSFVSPSTVPFPFSLLPLLPPLLSIVLYYFSLALIVCFPQILFRMLLFRPLGTNLALEKSFLNVICSYIWKGDINIYKKNTLKSTGATPLSTCITEYWLDFLGVGLGEIFISLTFLLWFSAEFCAELWIISISVCGAAQPQAKKESPCPKEHIFLDGLAMQFVQTLCKVWKEGSVVFYFLPLLFPRNLSSK